MFAAPNLLRHFISRGVELTPRARPASRRFRASPMVAYDADDVVLVVDGVVRGRKRPPPLTPGAWLETWTPRGVYTSARTFRGIHVAWYGAHVARLRRMLASLAEAEPELFEGGYERYLQNRLHEELPYSEVPIRLLFSRRRRLELSELKGGAHREGREDEPETGLDPDLVDLDDDGDDTLD